MNFLQRVPENLPILATTATANNRVIEDVREQLGNIGIQRGALMRETLALQTMRMPSSAERLAWLAEHVEKLPGTGIVYTLTHRDTEQVADWLVENGIPARAYYSGVIVEGFEDTSDYREHLEDLLLHNKLKVLGCVDISPQPDESGSEMKEAKVSGVQLLKPGEDPAVMLYFVDEAFHQMTLPV